MDKFMKIAINEALKGIENGDGGPFGAVIVKDGKVVAKAHNMVLKKQDSTCHGEMEAIRKACKKLGTFDLSSCTLYTTGYPCPMCFGGILWANICKVYYGCNTLDTEKIGFRDKKFENDIKNGKALEICEIGRKECLELYEKYNKITGKKNY